MSGIYTKTRIAPTPSGFLHLGNVYSFAITADLARKTGAEVLLRIDDLDQERTERDYIQDIFETLHFLNIVWTHGPRDLFDFEENFSQTRRMALYSKALQRLREKKVLYACTCSRLQIQQANANGIYAGTCRHKNIPLDTENVSWRIDTTKARAIHLKTLEGEIVKKFPPEMNDFVVRKKDGSPAYQLSSLIDDLYFNVDLIVRGLDLLPSTLAQLFLAELLEEKKFLQATFHHHSLLLDMQKRKLSKSDGATSIRYLRQHGVSVSEIHKMIGLKNTLG